MGEIIWGSAIAGLLAFETWAIKYRPGWTLSDVIRRVLHTGTTTGRVAFLLAWVLFAAWFGWHIAFQS